MALLKTREYFKYVLRFFYEINKAIHRSKIYDRIKEYTNPSEEDLKLVKGNGYSKFYDRIDWSLSCIKESPVNRKYR